MYIIEIVKPDKSTIYKSVVKYKVSADIIEMEYLNCNITFIPITGIDEINIEKE